MISVMFWRIHLIHNDQVFFEIVFIFQVTHIKAPKTAEDEFIEIESATGTAVQRWAVRSLTLCKLVGNTQCKNRQDLATCWLSS